MRLLNNILHKFSLSSHTMRKTCTFATTTVIGNFVCREFLCNYHTQWSPHVLPFKPNYEHCRLKRMNCNEPRFNQVSFVDFCGFVGAQECNLPIVLLRQ